MTFQKELRRSLTGFAFLVFAFAALGLSTGTAGQTQGEMNQDACDRYKKADAGLNQTYQRILAEYRRDKTFIEKLKVAQRAWLTFRDAHLASIYPAENPRAEYGSVNPMCQCVILEQMTKERTNILQQWTKGTIEGDVCAGSVKVKP